MLFAQQRAFQLGRLPFTGTCDSARIRYVSAQAIVCFIGGHCSRYSACRRWLIYSGASGIVLSVFTIPGAGD